MKIQLNTTTFLLGIIIILIIVLFFKDCTGNSTKNEFADPKMYHNDGTYSKQIQYISKDLSELKLTNDSLYKAIKSIKGEKTTINTIKMYYHTDTLRLPSTIVKYSDHKYGTKWSYVTKYQTIKGESRFLVNRNDSTFQILPDSTIITDNTYSASLITGIRKIKGKEEIFVKSEDPNFEIVDLQGYQVQRKTKHFVIGPQVGVGIIGNKVAPYFGIGIQYKLFEF